MNDLSTLILSVVLAFILGYIVGVKHMYGAVMRAMLRAKQEAQTAQVNSLYPEDKRD